MPTHKDLPELQVPAQRERPVRRHRSAWPVPWMLFVTRIPWWMWFFLGPLILCFALVVGWWRFIGDDTRPWLLRVAVGIGGLVILGLSLGHVH